MKRRIVLGFVVAAILLALLVSFIGHGEVFDELSGTNPILLVASLCSGILALCFRGLVWMQFLRAIDTTMTRGDVYGVFLSAMFIKYVTPYGQVATEPFVAYLVSRDTEMAYEDGLAGILSADVLNYVPYYTFGFVALGWIAVGGALGEDIYNYLLAFAAVFSVLVSLTYVVVRRPGVIYWLVLGVTGALRRPLERFSGGGAAKFANKRVRSRLDGFYGSIAVIGGDRRMLAYTTVCAHLAMVFLMLPVYIGGLALGYDIALSVVVLAVAFGKLGAFVPTPGGLGGVEGSVTIALTLLTSLSSPAAFSVAIIYRVSTYWVTIAVGGGAAFALVVRR